MKYIVYEFIDSLFERKYVRYELKSSKELKDFLFKHQNNLKKIEIFTDTPEKAARISFIVAAYSNLLSVFWKMENKKDYGFAFRYKDNIIKKIDDLLIAEYVTYNDISEGCKCWLKQ